MATNNTTSNQVRDVFSQCKVLIYPFNTQTLLESRSRSQLTTSEAFDISSRITNVQFSKTMGGASGNFSFTLANNADLNFQDDEKEDLPNSATRARSSSGDWKDIIRRGTWCIIYMDQNGNLTLNPQPGSNQGDPNEERPFIRCVGFIERVEVVSELNENGAFDITYQVSGRDFGSIYEDAIIWHNLFQFDTLLLEAAKTRLRPTQTTGIHEALNVVHDLFLSPENLGVRVREETESLTSIALQWLLPSKFVRDIGYSASTGGTFWGDLEGVKAFETTQMGFVSSDITDFLSGSAWQKLNQVAVREFHELYTETGEDGRPRLYFRPIPWAIDKSKYPVAGSSIKLYKDVETVVVDAEDVVNFELGEDNQNRYNSFLVTSSSSVIQTEDQIAFLKPDFPRNNQNSIRRYGFRAMHVTVPALTSNEQRKNGLIDGELLKEYNEVLYDYWNLALYTETGTAEMIGRSDVKIGKCLEFGADVPYASGRRYYIEGYTDQFTVLENGTSVWTQQVSLTRGFEKTDLGLGGGQFSARDNKFKRQGEYTSRRGR